MDAHAGLSLQLVHMSHCWVCHNEAHFHHLFTNDANFVQIVAEIRLISYEPFHEKTGFFAYAKTKPQIS